MEVNRHYPDLLLIPKENQDKYYGVMIEFKYLKKDQQQNLGSIQEEAMSQIEEYCKYDEIKVIPNLRKYTVVAVMEKFM